VADISMDYGALSSIGDAVNSLQGEVLLLISDYKSAAGEISGGWIGQGEERFSRLSQDTIPSISVMSDVLKKYKPVIDKAVAVQQATDEAGAASAGNLSF